MLQKKTRLMVAAASVAVAIALISSYTSLSLFADADSDGIPDLSDNCPTIPNPTQKNSDTDTLGNECDPDDDNDLVSDEEDVFDENPYETSDIDRDGTGDNTDLDDDNDKIVDAIDAFDTDSSEWADFDFDGKGSAEDQDDDNDGILDVEDEKPIPASEELTRDYLNNIQNCATTDIGTARLLCYGQFFEILVEAEKSNLQAIQLAFDLSKIGALDDCHFVSHQIGHSAFEDNPNVVENLIGMDSSICRGGFYHGIMSAYFHDVKENNDQLPDFKIICNDFIGKPDYQDCIHGMGHGFVHYYLNDIKSSVDSCHEMSLYQGSLCIGGVMMQYTDGELTKYSDWENTIPQMCSKLNLTEIDYHQCNVSLGLSLAYHTDHNPEIGSEFCSLIEDEKGKSACLTGLLGEIKNAESYKEKPLTNEKREKFQPQWIDSGNQIIDIRSPATISNFNYVHGTGLITFNFDKPEYIILFIPKEILPPKIVVTVNGEFTNDLEYKNNFMGEDVIMIRILPNDAGMVMIAPS